MNKAFIKQIQKTNLYPYYKGLYRGANATYRSLPAIGRGAYKGAAYALGVPIFISALLGQDEPEKAVLQIYKDISTSIKDILTNAYQTKPDRTHFGADK